MKKQIIILSIAVLIITGAAITAYARQKDNKGKKEQKHDQDKDKGNHGKRGNDHGNEGKNNNKGQPGNNNNNNSKNNGNDNSAKNNGNNNKNGNNGNNDKSDKNDKNDKNDNDRKNDKDGFSWNEENFKDRKKLKDQEKVTICHKVGKDNDPGVTIRVSSNATKAHMNHGDVMGECAATPNSKLNDIFLRKRNDYYNTLQNSYEQVSYSRSILDYAVQRLTNARLQLADMQRNNVARAELERKQAAVTELEQNVSLLETLIGVTTNIVVKKLKL